MESRAAGRKCFTSTYVSRDILEKNALVCELGDHRRLPQTHALAAGRLPLFIASDDPASEPLVAAPLPAAP